MEKSELNSSRTQQGAPPVKILLKAVPLGLFFAIGFKVEGIYADQNLTTGWGQDLTYNCEAKTMAFTEAHDRTSIIMRANYLTHFYSNSIRMLKKHAIATTAVAEEKRVPRIANLGIASMLDESLC